MTFIEKKLDDYADKMFPQTGKWYSHCFNHPIELVERNLPCHLRDNEWLSNYIALKFFLINKEVIKRYVETSEHFDMRRSEYEQRIVKWQIDWMLNDGEGWIVKDEYGGDFFMLGEKCDYAFREGVLSTLTNIGMDKEQVEKGIEVNAGMWRDRYIKLACSNKYSPVFYYQIDEMDPELKEGWIRLRNYEYYKNHKASVDKYGSINEDMKMKPEEAKELELRVAELGKKREEELENYVNSNAFKRRPSYAIRFDEDKRFDTGEDEEVGFGLKKVNKNGK